jgi:hypothetical protein
MPVSAPVRAEVVTPKGFWGLTAATAAACVLEWLALVAVIVTEVLVVTLGAVKTPVLEIVPALADQITAVSALPLMAAVNCCCACDARFALLGEIVIEVPLAETAIDAGIEPFELPAGFAP